LRAWGSAGKLNRQSSEGALLVAEGVGVDNTDRLRKLQALTDAALAHLELDVLLSTLLLRTREALAVDTYAVLLLDELRMSWSRGRLSDRGGGRARCSDPGRRRLRGPGCGEPGDPR
jgi:hypothetical protein